MTNYSSTLVWASFRYSIHFSMGMFIFIEKFSI